jgi:hypothetical protein
MSPPGIADDHLDDHRGNVIVEGAGHWVQQESPSAVNEALLTFLGSIDLREHSGTGPRITGSGSTESRTTDRKEIR